MDSRSEPTRHGGRRLGLLVIALGAMLALGAVPAAGQDGAAAPGDWLFIDADTVWAPPTSPKRSDPPSHAFRTTDSRATKRSSGASRCSTR